MDDKEWIDMCCAVDSHTVSFVLNPQNIWNSFDPTLNDITKSGAWKEVKFLNNEGTDLNDQISQIVPTNKGGVYVFVIKGGIIPNSHEYIMYIGRVQSTPYQNLRKRFREYYTDNRPFIRKMRIIWGRDLYIRFLPLTDNEIIKKIETELIRVIIPPCNDDVPEPIRQPVKAAF